MEKGVRLSKTSPSFLHANSTSHTWIFSAIAELIDNAYDPDCNASQLHIDKRIIGKKDCLTFTDNGNGMNPDKLHKMLSFGFCEKIEVNGHKPVGHYGNGFKSGSMRLGKDAIVFTKHEESMSVGILSQTFLKMTNAETVLTPIVTWDTKTHRMLDAPDAKGSIQAITTHSLFHSERELLNEFGAISGQTGTEIIIYNLKRSSDGMLELDFQSKPDDVMNIEYEQMDFNTTASAVSRPVVEHKPEYTRSLREYCSILFLKPRMKIVLRGSKVKTKLITKSLSNTEQDVYRPTWLKRSMKMVFGFSPQKQDYGVMLYHRNRLIKAYEKVGCQKQNNALGIGVVGVAEVDFLEPIHNKQDFNKTDRYNSCINALGRKLDDYWNEKIPADGNSTATNIGHSPDWTWVQCDNPKCLKWRRLPDGADGNNLPDKWYCYLNPDPTHNRCDIEEEPEDEDDVMKASYAKTFRRQQKARQSLTPYSLQHVQQRQELENRERMLQMRINQLKKIQTEIIQKSSQVSSSHGETKPSKQDLEKAQRELMEARRREEQQKEVIMRLQRKNKQIELEQKKLMDEADQLKLLTRQSEALPVLASTSDQPSASSTSSRNKRKATEVDQNVIVEDVGEDYIITRNMSSEDEEERNAHRASRTPGEPSNKKRREIKDSDITSSGQKDNNSLVQPIIKQEPEDVKLDLEQLNCITHVCAANDDTSAPQVSSSQGTTGEKEVEKLRVNLKNSQDSLHRLRKSVAELLNFLSTDMKIDSNHLDQVDEIVEDLNKQNRSEQEEEG